MSPRTTRATLDRRHARAAVLLGGMLLVVSAATLAGSTDLWPLFALPVIVAHPLAGRAGLAASLGVAAAVFVAISGEGVKWGQLAIAWTAFLVGAVLVAARHGKIRRDLERVEGASLRDRLTGLYNYAFFADTLRRETQRATRYGGPLSLVLFDLDGFKSFNDTHGHEAGNRLLAEVGRVMESSRRSADVAARFGGEEFALLVPGDAQAAAEAAERIRTTIAAVIVPVGRGQHDGRTISAGVASYRRGDPAEALVEDADRALYLSKHRGRNRVSVSGAPARAVRAAGA